MNTVVSKLLEVDRQSRQLLDEARQYYDKTVEEIETEKQKMLADYAGKAERHIADVRSAEAAQVDDAMDRIAADSGEKIRVLEQLWDEKHGQWEQEMFARCVQKVTPDA